jgi:phosphatidate cytidylyltransferase
MNATDWAVGVLLAMATGGIAAAITYALLARGRPGSRLDGRTAIRRAASYAVLAAFLALAVAVPDPGVAVLVGAISLLALWEWGRLNDLPGHHRYALLLADVVLVWAVHERGADAADWMIGGLILVGAAWPILRANTERAVRDLGLAAIGFVFVGVTLVHAVALVYQYGSAGGVLFAALALGCAGSDIGAFVVGRRFGRTPLAPSLSPAKTRAGVAGNFAGAAAGLLPLAPAVAASLAAAGVVGWYGLLLVPIIALGSVWGDLFESAAKREAGVKDAGDWLPGFGGILDRIDSLLITLPLAYWTLRLLELGGLA